MTAVAHSERAHARLSASGSKRWLSCTPSAALEDGFAESTSVFAEEGTAAHELADILLGQYLGLINDEMAAIQLAEASAGPYYSQEMVDHVQRYLDIVIEKINGDRAVTPDAVILIEQRLDFSDWVPDGFGTGDVVIIADGTMEIVDLKYGKGVPVSAEDNSQMRLYALGALNQFGMLYDVERVRMTIVQPRLDSVSTDELTTAALLEWANTYVKPRAAAAAAGEGEYVPGEHCRFCKAKAQCRALADANLELAKYEFREGPLLSHEEIADVLQRVDALVNWAKDVAEYALEQSAKHGIRYPGWKLVEGLSRRVYSDKDAVVDTLLIEGYPEGQIYKPRELLGITDMEKLVGKKKFTALLNPFVVKPAGKPVLVPESDKRPELSSAASAAADFAEDIE